MSYQKLYFSVINGVYKPLYFDMGYIRLWPVRPLLKYGTNYNAISRTQLCATCLPYRLKSLFFVLRTPLAKRSAEYPIHEGTRSTVYSNKLLFLVHPVRNKAEYTFHKVLPFFALCGSINLRGDRF